MSREPHAKRRKLSPPEYDGGLQSYASFEGNESEGSEESEESDSKVKVVSNGREFMRGSDESEFDVEDAKGTSTDDDESETESDVAEATKKPQSLPAQCRPRESKMQNSAYGIASALTSETYKSSTFKLQVEDLLQSMRPKYTSKDKAIGEVLRTVKGIIESIHPRQPMSILQAEATLRKGENIITPFPEPRPPKDANYKLQYEKPASVNVVGSFPLNLSSKTGDEVVIDLVVMMPDEIFQKKDYLNYRYFYKRAYYLACLAAGIQADKEKKYNISFEHGHGGELTPVLVVEVNRELLSLPCKTVKIVIRLAISEALFPEDKLLPSRNCVRQKEHDAIEKEEALSSTPFYNSSLRADSLITSYLTLLHQATQQCEAYRDACSLGRIWLRQKGFTSSIEGGGFGNFEWSALIALLLRGGGPNGKPAFSAGYSSYQLFKAMLQYLASRDLVKSPQVVGAGTRPESLKSDAPVLFDAKRALNLLFKMTPWSYQLLRHEATASMAMLSDSTFDHFDETFILKGDRALLRCDVVVETPITAMVAEAMARKARLASIYNCLVEGLSDRVKLITLTSSKSLPWKVGSKSRLSNGAVLRLGFVLDPANAQRLVDHGPAAEDKDAATRFRSFWGPKAELRRFRDGSIMETVVWSAKDESGCSVFRRVFTYIIERHIGSEVAKLITYNGDADMQLLPSLSSASRTATNTPFQSIMDAFKQLQTDIRNLDDLPLQIRHLLASDPFLSFSSIDIPHIPHTQMSRPADVILQFEGSARWPDDLDAIQRTKMAFSLKIAELLESGQAHIRARVGLENQDNPSLNQCFLDVHYTGNQSSKNFGAAFRIRIHHDRELTLLERQLKDKSMALSQLERQEVALAIAEHKRVFIKEPAHTQALQTLATRFPAFSGTVRLLWKWISSHRLANHISPQLVSLFAAKASTNPYPWSAASSPQAGFYRTLLFLSRWDYRTQPWIVDLGSEMREPEVKTLRTRFEAWRKIDPALNRVVIFAASNIDGEGNTWTDNSRPAKVVAGRLIGLAKAAVREIDERGAHLDAESLFGGGLEDYDFVIHLNPKVVRQGRKSPAQTRYKNLELQAHASGNNIDDFTLSAAGSVGFEPVKLFLTDLEKVFGTAALFFHDESSDMNVIAGLWNPTCEGRAWKLSLAYSSVPAKDGTQIQAGLNHSAMLAEMARLGGDMLLKIVVNKK